MIFRQLFDHDTWTYTYLVADEDTREAVLIDSVLDQAERDLRLIGELDVKLVYAIDTHVHADHITANGYLRERTGCRTGVSGGSGVACADLGLEDGQVLPLGAIGIEVIATPGHTDGCLSFRIGDRVFTGDSLFIRGCGRTDFQSGDSGRLYDSITQRLFTLPDGTLVYPGHDYHGHSVSTIGEEKRFNPRLTMDRETFIRYMGNLNLPDPRLIMEAVPANRSCGRT